MQNLLINRVKYKMENIPMMRLSKDGGSIFHKKSGDIKDKIAPSLSSEFEEWCSNNEIEENEDVFYDFITTNENDDFLLIETSKYFYPHYIRSVFMSYFEEKQFLVEKFPNFFDICIRPLAKVT